MTHFTAFTMAVLTTTTLVAHSASSVWANNAPILEVDPNALPPTSQPRSRPVAPPRDMEGSTYFREPSLELHQDDNKQPVCREVREHVNLRNGQEGGVYYNRPLNDCRPRRRN